MAVGFKVGNIIDEVGTHDFLHAFFSTMSYHLEPNGWGSRYPELMNELYQGKLDSSKAWKVLKDVEAIRLELKRHLPREVVWDIEDINKVPPWGNELSSEITDLSNYFVTSTGRDLFGVLIECLTASAGDGDDVTIESY
ncbi:MAG: immunity 70 family protein [Planctomycetia bacterium]|nr:immunity 70 family protein [Planctomycetia bacterium]